MGWYNTLDFCAVNIHSLPHSTVGRFYFLGLAILLALADGKLVRLNTSSCALHTVSLNKLNCQSLEQRKVYCRASQGEGGLCSKQPKLSSGFSGKSFYRQNLG